MCTEKNIHATVEGNVASRSPRLLCTHTLKNTHNASMPHTDIADGGLTGQSVRGSQLKTSLQIVHC